MRSSFTCSQSRVLCFAHCSMPILLVYKLPTAHCWLLYATCAARFFARVTNHSRPVSASEFHFEKHNRIREEYWRALVEDSGENYSEGSNVVAIRWATQAAENYSLSLRLLASLASGVVRVTRREPGMEGNRPTASNWLSWCLCGRAVRSLAYG